MLRLQWTLIVMSCLLLMYYMLCALYVKIVAYQSQGCFMLTLPSEFANSAFW